MTATPRFTKAVYQVTLVFPNPKEAVSQPWWRSSRGTWTRQTLWVSSMPRMMMLGKGQYLFPKRRKSSWGSDFNRGTFPGQSKSSTIRIWKTVTSLQSDENHPKKNRMPGSTQTSTVLTFPELSLLYPPASITDICSRWLCSLEDHWHKKEVGLSKVTWTRAFN